MSKIFKLIEKSLISQMTKFCLGQRKELLYWSKFMTSVFTACNLSLFLLTHKTFSRFTTLRPNKLKLKHLKWSNNKNIIYIDILSNCVSIFNCFEGRELYVEERDEIRIFAKGIIQSVQRNVHTPVILFSEERWISGLCICVGWWEY